MSVFPATEVIDLQSGSSPFNRIHSEPVLNAGLLKVVKIEIPAGKEMPRHSASDPATIHCLSGKVILRLDEEEHKLAANQMIFLDAHRPHVVKAEEESVLLITMRISDPAREAVDAVAAEDAVDEAVEDSFPASDPPSFNAST